MYEPQHWRDDLSPREDGLPSVAICRLLLHHLQCGLLPASAATATRLCLTTTLASHVAAWRRRRLVTMINLEDLTDPELARLLYDPRTGKFSPPAYEALSERAKEHRPVYPQWLAYFRTTEGRPHYSATFMRSYRAWLRASNLEPLQIRFEYVHIVRSMDELRHSPIPRWPGVKTKVVWRFG